MSRPTLWLLRLLGWRYSHVRHAWVHRIGGGRWGPVYRQRGDRYTSLEEQAQELADPPPVAAPAAARPAIDGPTSTDDADRPTPPDDAGTPAPGPPRSVTAVPPPGTGTPLPRRRPSTPPPTPPGEALQAAAPTPPAEPAPPEAAASSPAVDGHPPRRVASGPRRLDPPAIQATG